MTFTEKQIEQLSEPILAKNVKERDGNSSRNFSTSLRRRLARYRRS